MPEEQKPSDRNESFLPLDVGDPKDLEDELFEELAEDISTQGESPAPSGFLVPYDARAREAHVPTALSTTSGPGMRTAALSVLDIACRATAPSNMPFVLIPLYRIVYGLIMKSNHVSISAGTTKFIVAVSAAIGVKAFWDLAQPSLMRHFTCSMTYPVEHQSAKGIQQWLAANIEGLPKRHTSFLSGSLVFNIRTRQEEMYGQMMTAERKGWFWFKGRPIHFEFSQEKEDSQKHMIDYVDDEWDRIGSLRTEQQVIRVSTVGWSTAPLKEFIDHVSITKVAEANTTVLWEIKKSAQYVDAWKYRLKASRPLSTIDLDEDIKTDLLTDLDHFVGPSRKAWYGDRGIPYRRGYMFFGPPGTGKTSVCHALAGKYNSSLYIMSMNEVDSEQDMKRLFRKPRHGDILLLEDIDSAGITRESMRDKEDTKRKAEMLKTAAATKLSTEDDDDDESKKPKITLSGMLSAIDGLSDGVVLVMTSNKPESLEKALIRPGRIDKQVLFGNVSKAVAKSIFVRMYQDDDLAAARLNELGDSFTTHIPELKLTPAEIQGFLIEHSGKPEDAIAGVDQWVKDVLAAKEAGKNIVGDDGEGSGAASASKENTDSKALLKRIFSLRKAPA